MWSRLRIGRRMANRGGLVVFLALLLLSLLAAFRFQAQRQENGLPDPGAYPWVYLRDGRALEAGEQTVVLIAVGDINLGRGVMVEAALDEVTPWLRAADLALGNLESAIGPGEPASPTSGEKPDPSGPQPYLLIAPPAAAAALQRASFDLLGLANNHALDRGPAGLAETMQRLRAARITPVGAGADGIQAYQPIFRQVRGVRLAFLAFNAIPAHPEQPNQAGGWAIAQWDPERASAAVRFARMKADAVIVSIHWGYEYQDRSDPAQRGIARILLEAGADLVAGHHPHVVQETALHNREGAPARFVAFSLGNFVFDQGQGETGQGLGLRAFFDRQGLRAVQALPVSAGPRPGWMDPEQSAALLKKVRPPRQAVAFTCNRETCTPVEPPETAETGIFRSGQLDLTGDGIAEIIRREGDRLVIERQGKIDWESPPEWRVIDVATGDPDQDGRADLMLALLKPDKDGVLRSHPFVFGYRGGLYRTLWGGSAVGDPIREVEVGDVDGDGLAELIVLEELRDGQGRAVTVWRWHGWGFSLQWRSPVGDYEDMLFIPESEENLAVIRVYTGQ